MKYWVTRTSEMNSETPPFPEAVFIKKDDPYPDFIDPTYYYGVEINTIEELHDFIEKYGKVVISNKSGCDGMPHIEIYDYFRE